MKALKEIGASALIVFSMVGSLFCIHEIATANATPNSDARAFCTNMDIVSERDGEPNDVTVQDITDVLHDMYNQGVGPDAGAQIVADAVKFYCPEWAPVITEYSQELGHSFTIADPDWRVVWKTASA